MGRSPDSRTFKLVDAELDEFEEFVRRTLPEIRRRADRLSGGHYEFADECVQQSLITAAADSGWSVLRDLTPAQQRGWMVTTVTNKALDGLRQRNKNREVCVDEVSDRAFRDSADSGDIAQQAITSLDGQGIYRMAREALADVLLPEHKMPHAVLLLDLADYTTVEISRVLGITLSTVRSHRCRGQKMMCEARATWRLSMLAVS